MQYEASSPKDYLSQLDDDWRRATLQSLRKIIKAQAPELKEGINYKMLSYGVDEDMVFHLNAQKNYVSLYVGDASKIDPDGALLEGLDCGKGCIRFKKSASVSGSRIDEFVDAAVKRWRKGGDIGC